MLIEDTIVPVEALPITLFRAHLRMGTGFADDNLQDGLLERHLRAALAAIEARTGKIILARGFQWTVPKWQTPLSHAFPIGPVTAVTAVTLIDNAGQETPAPEIGWAFATDNRTQTLVATTGHLPAIPDRGQARIAFSAGRAAEWGAVPPDIGQATFLLAAHFYEFRHTAEGRGVDIPLDVAALLAPHRGMRIGFGGRTI